MIERYTRPGMRDLWSESTKKAFWHRVECAALWAREQLRHIQAGLSEKASAVQITPELLARADTIEAETDHDLIAFVLAVTEQLPSDVKPHYHTGETSYDIEDTATALQMRATLRTLLTGLDALNDVLKRRAQEHRETIMIGRTHGIHAEPITFGVKLLTWLDVMLRHRQRVTQLLEEVCVGKNSGAVGMFALDPRIEELMCSRLGLEPARISTQVISRDLHVRYVMTLVGIANSIDRFAVEIRNLARTEIREVAEFKRPGNKGSSAMPGKTRLRNPIKSENLSGLAKLMRGYLTSILECEPLWHERSLDNSSAERVILPDVSCLTDFMLHRFTATVEKLEVFPAQMLRNLNLTGGIVFAQRVLQALCASGIERPEAYNLIEALTLQVELETLRTLSGQTFLELVETSPEIQARLSEDEIMACFDPQTSLSHLDPIFSRFAL